MSFYKLVRLLLLPKCFDADADAVSKNILAFLNSYFQKHINFSRVFKLLLGSGVLLTPLQCPRIESWAVQCPIEYWKLRASQVYVLGRGVLTIWCFQSDTTLLSARCHCSTWLIETYLIQKRSYTNLFPDEWSIISRNEWIFSQLQGKIKAKSFVK